tara:strand:+ start:3140 stop:4489 length:1350 start_codon:yes stop_codon:yes gene_type:complete
MNQRLLDNIDIFQSGGAADADLLDIFVEGYEQNVPLPAQILAGFTPPGMALDIAAGGKYGRDAIEEFREGNIKPGLMYAGIAGLSTLGAIPLIGELFRPGKEVLKKGITSLATSNTVDDVVKHQADIFSGDPVRDSIKIYDRAKRSAPEFNQQIDNIAAQLNLQTNLPGKTIKIDAETLAPAGKVKKIPRIVEKSRTKYGNDVSKLTDPIRTRVLVKTPNDEEKLVLAIKQNYEVFDKGRLVKPEGFVDRKLIIKFTNSRGEPIVGEISAITEPMWKASDKNHKLFEQFRSLFPKGMPEDINELAKIGDDIVKQGEALKRKMAKSFGDAQKQIDPGFYKTDVKKFAMGGYVAAGNTGNASPITPNLLSNDVLDIFRPSTKKSTNWPGSARVQPVLPGDIKYPKYPASTGATTAGPSSQAKYNVSFSINPSIQKYTKNYNLNEIDIFEDD